MPTTEQKVVSAVCKNGDIHSILGEDAELFGPYQDVFDSIKGYYFKYKTVPSFELLRERFSDLEAVDTSAPTAFYVEELKSEYLQSHIEKVIVKAANSLENDKPARVLDGLFTDVARLGKYTNTVRDLNITDEAAALEHFEKLRRVSEDNNGTPGISTGFASIDSAYTTGFAPGHSIIMLGYTSRGKSFAATLLAIQAWRQGYKPMIVSLEMSPEEQMERIYTMMASGIFKISELARGDVGDDDFKEWSKKNLQGKSDFVIVSSQGVQEMTPNVIQAKIDTHKPDLVLLDYFQLMKDNAKTQGMTPRMLNLSREVKMLAVSNNIPIISISSVTDEENDKRDSPPVLSQVAWSSGIEFDANLAFAVHRHDDSNMVEFACRKNRHGPLFNFMFEVDFDRGIWTERFDT